MELPRGQLVKCQAGPGTPAGRLCVFADPSAPRRERRSQVTAVLKVGGKNRSTASTEMNADSSRTFVRSLLARCASEVNEVQPCVARFTPGSEEGGEYASGAVPTVLMGTRARRTHLHSLALRLSYTLLLHVVSEEFRTNPTRLNPRCRSTGSHLICILTLRSKEDNGAGFCGRLYMVRLSTTPGSLQGEYRAGGRVHTPSRVVSPVGRAARQLHSLAYTVGWTQCFAHLWNSSPPPSRLERR